MSTWSAPLDVLVVLGAAMVLGMVAGVLLGPGGHVHAGVAVRHTVPRSERPPGLQKPGSCWQIRLGLRGFRALAIIGISGRWRQTRLKYGLN